MPHARNKKMIGLCLLIASFSTPILAWSQNRTEGARFLATIPSSSLSHPFRGGHSSVPRVFSPAVAGFQNQETISGSAFGYQMREVRTALPLPAKTVFADSSEPNEDGQLFPGVYGPIPQASGFTAGADSQSSVAPGHAFKRFAIFARCAIGSFYVHQFNLANPKGIEGELPKAKLQDQLCPQTAEYYLKKAGQFSHWFFGL